MLNKTLLLIFIVLNVTKQKKLEFIVQLLVEAEKNTVAIIVEQKPIERDEKLMNKLRDKDKVYQS